MMKKHSIEIQISTKKC